MEVDVQEKNFLLDGMIRGIQAMLKKVRLRRKKVYRDVWTRPIHDVAQQYGVTESTLQQVCMQLNVPLPQKGYWKDRQAGKSVRMLDLPDISTVQEVVVEKTGKGRGQVNDIYPGLVLNKPLFRRVKVKHSAAAPRVGVSLSRSGRGSSRHEQVMSSHQVSRGGSKPKKDSRKALPAPGSEMSAGENEKNLKAATIKETAHSSPIGIGLPVQTNAKPGRQVTQQAGGAAVIEQLQQLERLIDTHCSFESLPNNRIQVLKPIDISHRLTDLTRAALELGLMDRFSRVRPRQGERSLDVSVHQRSVERALQIIDALAKGLEARQCKIVFERAGRRRGLPAVRILGERVPFSLTERVAETKEGRSRRETDTVAGKSKQKIALEPTGVLRLTALGEFAGGNFVEDLPSWPLEEQLNNFVLLLVREAVARKQRRLKTLLDDMRHREASERLRAERSSR